MKAKKLLLSTLLLLNLFIHAQNGKPINSAVKKLVSAADAPQVILKARGTIYVNLDQAIFSANYVDIPFSFTSPDSIEAFDFAMQFTETVLSYQSIVSTASYLTDALAKYSLDDKTLRFTSNSRQYYKVNQPIVTMRFNRLTNDVDESDIFSLVGYLNGDQVKMELKGHFPIRTGSLKFWLDSSPIAYDVNATDDYLITNIYGVDSACSNKSVAVQPNLNGQFDYNNANGPFIQIERDILPSTNVQPVINGLDVNLAHKVLVNDLSFIPTIYQAIALDVNADGVISAGDISQINQRSVKTITEFRQKWNYTNNGSNGQLSKDWLFVDSTALASPAYQLSSTYPLNDQVGYSKAKVPVVHFCILAPAYNSNPSYTGVLLGDVNGNYATVSHDGKIKRMSK